MDNNDLVKRLTDYANSLGSAFPQCDGEMLVEEAISELWRLREDNLRLRKIAAYVPPITYIAAKERAGYGQAIQPMTPNAELRGAKPIGEASRSNDVLGREEQ